jgi:hypothetical protein
MEAYSMDDQEIGVPPLPENIGGVSPTDCGLYCTCTQNNRGASTTQIKGGYNTPLNRGANTGANTHPYTQGTKAQGRYYCE